MSPNTQSEANGRHRSRAGRRLIAGTVAAGLTIVGLAVVNTQSASATTAADSSSKPLAQSVGNFLDATLGGNPLDATATLSYAKAVAPGTTSAQNPLDATALTSISEPLSGALQLPQVAGITLGAVNQVAKAQADGYSYGASGAVDNSGGVSVGGDNNAFPANASINLTGSAIAGNSVPIPGGGTADALGGVTMNLGAVSALAQTPVGVDKGSSTNYQIAGLSLSIGSPLVGQLLNTALTPVLTTVGTLLTTLSGLAPLGLGIPASCTLLKGELPNLELEKANDGSAVITIVASGEEAGTITVDLDALLKVLGLDLNHMAPNTDLIDYLLAYLTDPKGLATALPAAITGLTDSIQDQLTACAPAGLAQLLAPLIGPSGLVSKLTDLGSTLAGALGGATGVASPLAPVASLLKGLVDIGINVQPNGAAGPEGAAYVDPLAATPKQGTPVVPGQTVVRAIEVNVAAGPGSSLPSTGSIPGLGSLLGGLGGGALPLANVHALAAPSSGLLTLALANAAAGPSSAAAAPTTPAGPTTTAPPANPSAVPTGVPAGMGTTGGTPVLPIVLLIVGLLAAGGGVAAFKFRGRHVI